MYAYFEHQRDASGKITLTEICLSSHGNGTLKIDFFSNTEEMLFELAKSILKYPPVAMRSYDGRNNVWAYFEDWGEQVLQKLSTVLTSLGPFRQLEVENLAAQAMNHHVSFARKPQVRPEDFFYSQAAPAPSALTKETVLKKLSLLLQIDTATLATAEPGALKKLYRTAALRLHPDRNNGNGAAMSELNMLWSVYNG